MYYDIQRLTRENTQLKIRLGDGDIDYPGPSFSDTGLKHEVERLRFSKDMTL